MKVFVLFVLLFCVQSSHQQLNRQQNQIQSLTYSEADYNALPPISRTTTTTEEPETTTKKKGFFSGFTGLFKSKDKESTTQEPATTKKAFASVSSTTVKAITSTLKSIPTNAPVVPVSTLKVPPRSESPASAPKVPPRPESLTPSSTPTFDQRTDSPIASTTPKVPPRSEYPSLPSQPKLEQTSSTTAAPKKTIKDDFPPLPTQPNKQKPTATPSLPNAWRKPPGIASSGAAGPTVKPQSFFTQQVPSSSTTKKPQVASQASTVSGGPVTDAELLTLSESLFSKDINNAFKFVTVNYQGRTQSSAKTDEALQPLLKIDDKLFAQSTVEKMKLLYNNYELDAAVNEYVSPNERKEEDEFIDAVLTTPVMRHAMNFLTQKGIVTADPQTHRELLKTIWFNLYSRGMGKIGSSGFEHVFLSEMKNGTVMGLHNWIYMSEAEKSGDLDYQGWMKKIDLGNKGQIAKVRFTLNKFEKPSNSLFIGTSPELELALYTVCFELRADKDCRLAYGGKDFNIITHSYRYRGKNLIGSAYPEI